MTKQVRETTAGKSISAYVVLNKAGRHVATVQAHYGNGGTVTVDVWNIGDTTTKRSAEAMGYTFDAFDKVATFNGKPTTRAGDYAYKVAGLQQGRAGGGGYDKFAAALSGLYIDGHAMTDHCGATLKRPAARLWTDADKAKLKAKGYTLSGWSAGVEPGAAWPAERSRHNRQGVADDVSGYTTAYRLTGLEYLTAIGYQVVQAI